MQKSYIFAFNPTLAAICKIIFKWRPGSKVSTMDQLVNFIMIGVQYRLQGVTMYNVQYMYIVQCTKIGLQYRFQGVTMYSVQYMYIVQRLASNIDFKVSHTLPICLIRSLPAHNWTICIQFWCKIQILPQAWDMFWSSTCHLWYCRNFGQTSDTFCSYFIEEN